MSYIKYEMDIVDYYKVIMEGWPLDIFISPRKINAMKALQTLSAALEPNDNAPPTCKFHALTDAQFIEYQAVRVAKGTQGPGDNQEHVRKERSDKGMTRGPYKCWENVEEVDKESGEVGMGKAGKWKRGKENEQAGKSKKPKSKEIVESDQDSN